MTAAHSTPKRGEVYRTDAGVTVLVVSSTVYNEVLSEPTVVVVPVFDSEPDAGFGVDIGDGWAAPGLISSLRKTRLTERRRRVDVQALTDVNTMLFRILATPERCSHPPVAARSAKGSGTPVTELRLSEKAPSGGSFGHPTG